MHKSYRFCILTLMFFALASTSVFAEDFALVSCTLDAKGRLLASMVDTADRGVDLNRQAAFEFELVGQPCAVAIGRLLDVGFELVGRTPITMCETGPCPQPPPPPPPPKPPSSSNPDCLIWDIAGDGVFALVSCEVAAPDGPTINRVQSDDQPTSELLANARGMNCSDFMSEFLTLGGRILGRSVVHFESIKSHRLRRYEARNNSILFELSAPD